MQTKTKTASLPVPSRSSMTIPLPPKQNCVSTQVAEEGRQCGLSKAVAAQEEARAGNSSKGIGWHLPGPLSRPYKCLPFWEQVIRLHAAEVLLLSCSSFILLAKMSEQTLGHTRPFPRRPTVNIPVRTHAHTLVPGLHCSPTPHPHPQEVGFSTSKAGYESQAIPFCLGASDRPLSLTGSKEVLTRRDGSYPEGNSHVCTVAWKDLGPFAHLS